ncbi:MAG TPA: sugar phosphate nucleotidyltransferase [Rhizomicrobium sp.]|jgi:NDP-sugar pyrophosphorylase family protein
MKAVILAGGKGTRLAPYTTVLPKPLMPVGDMPILEILIRQLRHHGITDIVLCVGYLAPLLEAYFGNGEKLGVSIRYSHEDEPLGTAGPLALPSGLDETFFAMNGDLLTTIDFSAMLKFHRAHGKIATVGLADKRVKIDLGVIEAAADGQLVNYIEKPQINYKISMGIYVFEPAVLDHVRGVGRIDLPDLILKLVREKQSPMTFDSNCEWLDIGRTEDYAAAAEEFEKNRDFYLWEKRS